MWIKAVWSGADYKYCLPNQYWHQFCVWFLLSKRLGIGQTRESSSWSVECCFAWSLYSKQTIRASIIIVLLQGKTDHCSLILYIYIIRADNSQLLSQNFCKTFSFQIGTHGFAVNNTVLLSHPSTLPHEIPSLQSSVLISREWLISHSFALGRSKDRSWSSQVQLRTLNSSCTVISYCIVYLLCWSI